MSTEPAAELLTLTYRADLDLLVGRWGYQPAVAELPAVYATLKEKALAAGCRFWLQDIRRRAFNDPATTQWLLAEFFPVMGRQLGGRLAVAYLVSPMLMEAIVSGPAFREPSTHDQPAFVVAFFGDEGEALTWLNRQRPALSGSTVNSFPGPLNGF